MRRTDPRIGEPEEWTRQHNPATEDGFAQDSEGRWLPAPTGKSIRQLVFKGGLMLNAEETSEQLKSGFDEAMRLEDQGSSPWVKVTDPAFGEPVFLSPNALSDLAWIAEAWMDMTAAREQMRQRDMARRLAAAGIAKGSAPTPIHRVR